MDGKGDSCMITAWVALTILISAAVVLSGVSAFDDARSRRVVGFAVR
jgi:hypothetical protein